MEARRNMASLQRLIARAPGLNENPAITALLSKGSQLTSEDIVDMCQKLFLRPELTVMIGGCFRHLLPQIIKALVDALRESYAQRTLPEISNELTQSFDPTSSWNLCIHEHAVIAFSRTLELAPPVLSSILEYFLFAPPPFERLLSHRLPIADQKARESQPSLLDVARASYRFILLEPASFETIWNWSPFLDLLLFKGCKEFDVRWCAVQVLALTMKLSDEATRALSLKFSCLTETETFSCLLRWEEFCHEIAVEKAGWFVEPPMEANMVGFDSKLLDKEEHHIKWKLDPSGSVSHVDICGIQLPIRKNHIRTGLPSSFKKSMLSNPNLKGNLKTLALALRQQEPILLEGCAGSGKTTLIRELCELTGNTDAVFIHLSEQVDAKTLLGTYVCTEIPGEFRWQPGAITQSVLQGLWLVLEDVDKAHSEVRSALIPLLENRQIYIPGRAETIKAALNFQLFSTVTRTDAIPTSRLADADVLKNLWRRVVLSPPGDSELGSIIEMLFPTLKLLVPILIDTQKLIETLASNALLSIDAVSTRIYFGRQLSIKDLLKWCKRLNNVKEIGHDDLSPSVRERIFAEAVDCFAACISDVKSRRVVVNEIAKLWGVGEEHANNCEVWNKPLPQVISGAYKIGRASLSFEHCKAKRSSHRRFAYTGHSLRFLERIAVCVQQQEQVLLVGETGTGKTTLVQHLADQLSVPLIVMNLSQQSDSSDFIGGFKPVEVQQVCMKLLDSFKELFNRTFPLQSNSDYLARVHQFAEKRKFKQLLKAFEAATAKVKSLREFSRICNGGAGSATLQQDEPAAKRKRPLTSELMSDWEKFSFELHKSERQVLAAESSFAFAFVEGAFVRAWKDGYWILLDELNLAPVETLERLTGVLEGVDGSLNLTERGDIISIPRHPSFRVFACMNPATDVGKHDLPMSLRTRFTEIYMDEAMGVEDLHLFVLQYLDGLMPNPPVAPIVQFYQQALQAAEFQLYDSANQKPRYNLRSLARALEYTQFAMPFYGFTRALYDGVCMTFLTLLDHPSSVSMENLIQSQLLKNLGLTTKNILARSPGQPSPNHMEFEHFWLEKGNWKLSASALEFTKRYVLTKTVKEHLKHVAKAVFIRKYPVLLQGPTSSGKTSCIEYLAAITSHRFVRINNHEHTDLQEYLGTYVTNAHGKLVFQEGILVDAVRNGYWVVLDELNLAPSEVLEALNRLLDDNRELFIPELQLVVKPHPHFMLFATQNPPGLYGGRKILSRAFRNRFIELHVDDIPEDELCVILEQRCEIPKSYAEKMVTVMKDLQRNRQTSQAFAGKHGFITARDLFKWADRLRRSGMSYDDLARIGYILLAERLRDMKEKFTVRACLEKNLRTKINIDTLYSELAGQSYIQEVKKKLAAKVHAVSFGSIVWTKSMTRLCSLVKECYQNKEPVLLIGETGCGKTTVCQLLSVINECNLRILNCHQHTETSDFLGGFRPVRDRESIAAQFEQIIAMINSSKLFCSYSSEKLPHCIEFAGDAINTLRKVIQIAKVSGQFVSESMGMPELEQSLQKLESLKSDHQAIFVWQDGPLVEAMRKGDFFLIDEISLADDSVLERLNSVLEPKRLLVLAEKGGTNVEELSAHSNFFLMATMNPGGDFGKKELSPALRNRFTEIWVPPITEEDDLRSIIHTRFLDGLGDVLTDPLLKFWKWYQEQPSGRLLTVRDLLSWIVFVNSVQGEIGKFSAFIHGAFLVLLDGISLEMGISSKLARSIKNQCLEFLLQQLPAGKQLFKEDFNEKFLMSGKEFKSFKDKVGIEPFFICKESLLSMTGPIEPSQVTFELMAPTTGINTFRILRAMQLPKPVLIEGSPGVGKTSLITALANITGHSLVRINLSEQTDMMDLLGSDLPLEGGGGADFTWSDGVFLQALKVGSWVILDELNLASQSVLEGLNSCLDHRGDVYIPELGKSFKCHPTFRIFACQNPHAEGGGRKCLPRSFLNRFIKVYVDTLCEGDFLFISKSLYPNISTDLLQKLIHFNSRILKDAMAVRSYGNLGGPWEFNLRDVLRSCALIEGSEGNNSEFLEIVYLQRLRTSRHRAHVLKIYEEVFGSPAKLDACPSISLDPKCLQIGGAVLPRSAGPQPCYKENFTFLPSQLKCMESLLFCVKHSWMSIVVGPAGSGKTSIVRLLARLMGRPLQEFVLSSGTDTTDLLGCFEQYDAVHCWKNLVTKVGGLVKFLCGQCLISFDKTFSSHVFMASLQKMLAEWWNFEKVLNLHTESSLGPYFKPNMEKNMPDSIEIDLLLQVVGQVKFVVSMFSVSLQSVHMEVGVIENDLVRLKKKVSSKANMSCFEWIDGGFLRAVQDGDWVLLKNANMCSPTVLDRLNPLVEPNGAILINERGLTSTGTVLQAHPDFRLFLTVDPSHGEVSRAMRNRGVEIHLMQPHACTEDVTGVRRKEEITQNSPDPRQFLINAGIPSRPLVAAMSNAHKCASRIIAPYSQDYSAHLRELRQWVSLFWQLLNSGSSMSESLFCSWEQVYLQGYEDSGSRDVMMNLYRTCFPLSIFDAMVQSSSTLQICGGWPRPLNVRDICRMSIEAVTIRDCMYVKHLLGELAAYQLRAAWCGDEINGKKAFSKWMENREIAVVLPAPLFQFFLFPSSSKPLVSTEGFVQDLKIFECKVLYACFWIMRQASNNSTREMRCMWLKWQAAKLWPHCNSLKLFCNVLELESGHPVYEQTMETFGPCGSRNDNHLRLLDSLRRSLMQWQIENNMLEKSDQKILSKTDSLIICSFKVYKGEHKNDLLELRWSDPALEVYPLLLAVRNLEEKLLLCGPCEWSKQTCKTYLNLLDNHKQLYRAACEIQCESDVYSDCHGLYVCWKKLRQGAVKLRAAFSLEKEIHKFMQIVWRIEAAFCTKRKAFKLYLWKHSGHPNIPASESAFQQSQAVLTFCHVLWPSNTYGKENFTCVSSNEVFRRLVLEGVAMALSVLQGRWKIRENISVQETQETVANDILKNLHERLNAQKSQKSFSLDSLKVPGCKCFPSHLLQNSCYREALLKGCRQSTNLFVLPWLDSLSLMQDSIAVAFVTQIASRLTAVGQHDVSLNELAFVKDFLLRVISFSMEFSSRSPLEFVPHQQILWLINAISEGSFNRTFTKDFQSFAHTLRFNWYSAVFQRGELRDDQDPVYTKLGASLASSFLINASNSVQLSHIIMEVVPLKQLHCKILEMRLAWNVLWGLKSEQLQCFPETEFLHASSTFCQLIYSFAKTFEKVDAAEIRSLLNFLHTEALQGNNDEAHKKTQNLLLLLKKSTDERFVASVESHIGVCLEYLYCQSVEKHCSTGSLYVLGKAWHLVGATRLRLLLPCHAYDPAAKYSYLHSVLFQKLSEAKLELQTRQENDLVVHGSTLEEQSELQIKIQELEQEIEATATKCVYRRNAEDLRLLYNEINSFVKSMDGVEGVFARFAALEANFGKHSVRDISKEVLQWQDISKEFIQRILLKYPDYMDLAQPMLLAVLEVKQGLTLLLTASQQKTFVQQTRLNDHLSGLCEQICNFIEFPTRNTTIDNPYSKAMSSSRIPALSFLREGFIESFMTTIGLQHQEKEMIRLKVKLFHCAILYIKNTLLRGGVVSELLRHDMGTLLASISAFWRATRDNLESKRLEGSSLIKFKHQSYELGLVEDQGEDRFQFFFPESFELAMDASEEVDMSDENGARGTEKTGVFEKDWKEYECELGKEVNELLSLIFNLQAARPMCGLPGEVSEEKRLLLFSSAYGIGNKFLEGIGAFLPANLNERLLSTHMLMLSLKHESLSLTKQDLQNFNIYEDPCPCELALLLSSLEDLEQSIMKLLAEWPNHPLLVQLMCGVEALMTMHVDVPLVKALTGVQQLLLKAESWEDNAPKHLSLQGVLNSLRYLVFKWRKLEFEYWETLMQKVESQFDREADKLWFPLHGVLHSITTFDSESQLEPLISSLEEFMQTAALGEYKRRLQMLSGFYGEFCIQKSLVELPSNSLCLSTSICNILFNLCGYYTQFLPLVENSITNTKKDIAKELMDFLKLQKWDERNYHASTQSSENTHRKLFKFVNRYKGLLDKPALASVIDKSHLWSTGHAKVGSENGQQLDDDLTKAPEELSEVVDCENQTIFSYQRFFSQCIDITNNEHAVIEVDENLCSVLPRYLDFLKNGAFSEKITRIRQRSPTLLEDLAVTVISRSNELREGGKSQMMKKTALVDLLRELRSLGFDHHRSAIPKEKRSPRFWILQDSCKVDCFLNFFMRVSPSGFVNESSFDRGHVQSILHSWNKACMYYFKNRALIQQLQQLSLNFHKDLTLKEVAAAISYLEHGLFIQQMQRSFAHKFSFTLVNFQNVAYELGHFEASLESVFWKLPLGKPEFERKWLWLQKSFLDSFYDTCLETLLFYKKAEAIHNCSCESKLSGASTIISRLETLKTSLRACKENLDEVLVPGIQLFSVDDLEFFWPILITPKYKQIILDNFSTASNAKDFLEVLFRQADHNSSALQALYEQCCKASKMFEDYKGECKEDSLNTKMGSSFSRKAYETQRNQLITEIDLSMQTVTRIYSQINTDCISVEHSSNSEKRASLDIESERVQLWISLMEEQMDALRLESISQAVVATVLIGVRGFEGEDVAIQNMLCKELSMLVNILKALVAAGITLFADYISLHKSLAKLSYVLGNLFEALFQEGFCKTQGEGEQEFSPSFEERSGTGLGEGKGIKDISSQIEDENQLLGTSEKGLQEDGTPKDKESTSEKGIEMGEDFEGDLMDVSDSESNESQENGDDDLTVESKMGDCGENGNIVDESAWSKDKEENAGQKGIEKYETGSSVKETSSDLEFRAKETNSDGPEDCGDETQGKEDHSWENSDGFEDRDDFDGIFEEGDAYEKPSGTDPSVEHDAEENKPEVHEADDTENLTCDAMNDSMDKMDICSDVSETEEGEGEEQEPSNMEIADTEQVSKESVEDEASNYIQETRQNKILEHPSNQVSGSGLPQCVTDLSSALQTSDLLSESANTSSMESSLPEVSKEPVKGLNLTFDDPKMDSSGSVGPTKQNVSFDGDRKEDCFQNLDRVDANPYRSLGDILQEWKERVTVRNESALETPGAQSSNEELDLDASEYQYVTEDTDSGPQALGSATLDQMSKNKVSQRENILNEEIAASISKIVHNKEENSNFIEETSHQGSSKHSIKNCEDDDMEKQEAIAMLDLEISEAFSDHEESRTGDQSYLSMNFNETIVANPPAVLPNTAWYNSEDAHYIRKDLESALSKDSWTINKASSLWAMYEQLITRLSQELTEQLRLIMEPTLASRLEGDYRTGKRINLKKVIPYIASQFRKDKIWLRRTKPSKREYQVVLAIDDSKSMSESHCGHLALEALLTICKSMSTLDVGQMAVASFGQKGNVKILHDFDSPFTREAGIEMISQFSFKQDNTIADEPMADLLNSVTLLLDVAAKNTSRSGLCQLQQLVLIIADGRFHEKEKLRRCIREAVSKGQMLAFIVLDSSSESILDVQSVSFSGGAPTFSKYIDTFPFPYYILLRNIEELPRILADLLRQWFEMVHRARLP